MIASTVVRHDEVVVPAWDEFEKSRPREMTLFEYMEGKKHTNSLSVYDVMPKYVFGKQDREKISLRDGRVYWYLPPLTRDFEVGDREYRLIITPARLFDAEGNEKDSYPGLREQMVELAIRHISIERQRLHHLQYGHNVSSGLKFSLTELRHELADAGQSNKKGGHGYKIGELRAALEVMHRCRLQITTTDGGASFSAPIFPGLGLRSRVGGPPVSFVTFNPMVTEAILFGTYRQMDYQLHMSLKSHIARWLHIRLIHQFDWAALMGNPYHISSTTIIRDAGLQIGALTRACESIRAAWGELKEKNVISTYAVKRVTGHRAALVEEIYDIHPSYVFATDQKRANSILNHLNAERGTEGRKQGG